VKGKKDLNSLVSGVYYTIDAAYIILVIISSKNYLKINKKVKADSNETNLEKNYLKKFLD